MYTNICSYSRYYVNITTPICNTSILKYRYFKYSSMQLQCFIIVHVLHMLDIVW